MCGVELRYNIIRQKRLQVAGYVRGRCRAGKAAAHRWERRMAAAGTEMYELRGVWQVRRKVCQFHGRLIRERHVRTHRYWVAVRTLFVRNTGGME